MHLADFQVPIVVIASYKICVKLKKHIYIYFFKIYCGILKRLTITTYFSKWGIYVKQKPPIKVSGKSMELMYKFVSRIMGVLWFPYVDLGRDMTPCNSNQIKFDF